MLLVHMGRCWRDRRSWYFFVHFLYIAYGNCWDYAWIDKWVSIALFFYLTVRWMPIFLLVSFCAIFEWTGLITKWYSPNWLFHFEVDFLGSVICFLSSNSLWKFKTSVTLNWSTPTWDRIVLDRPGAIIDRGLLLPSILLLLYALLHYFGRMFFRNLTEGISSCYNKLNIYTKCWATLDPTYRKVMLWRRCQRIGL